MMVEERRASILKALQEDRRVSSADLAARFGVSEDAIRRDLRDLAADGLVRRVYGGALPVTPASTFSGRIGLATAAKNEIVQTALGLIRPGMTLLLDSGTTVAALAAALPLDTPLTVITHSLPAAVALIEKPSVKVCFLGGVVQHGTAITCGAEVLNGYARCRGDICFLGACSVDAVLGVGVLEPEEAEIKRVMMQSATEIVAMAASHKLGRRCPFIVGPATSVDILITESDAGAEHVRAIEEAGVKVLVRK